jgi:hypothetical protein
MGIIGKLIASAIMVGLITLIIEAIIYETRSISKHQERETLL